MKKLSRSNKGKIAGVCDGLAYYLKTDSNLIRLIFVIAFIIPMIPATLSYIACWIILPKHNTNKIKRYDKGTDSPKTSRRK